MVGFLAAAVVLLVTVVVVPHGRTVARVQAVTRVRVVEMSVGGAYLSRVGVMYAGDVTMWVNELDGPVSVPGLTMIVLTVVAANDFDEVVCHLTVDGVTRSARASGVGAVALCVWG